MASAQLQFGSPERTPFPTNYDPTQLAQALRNVTWCRDNMHGIGVCADTVLNGDAVRVSLGYAMLNRLGDSSPGAHLKEVSYLQVFNILSDQGEKRLQRLYLDYYPAVVANHGSSGALANQFVTKCAGLFEQTLPTAEKLPVIAASLSHQSLFGTHKGSQSVRVAAWKDVLTNAALTHVTIGVPEAEVLVLLAAPGQQPGAAAFTAFRALIDPITNPKIGAATGATQIPLYQEAVKSYQDGWKKLDEAIIYNLDEFFGMSAYNAKSYRAFMTMHLYSKIKIPVENVHFPSELTSKTYSQEIAAMGNLDLCIGGIGHNGHFGFNEPGSKFTSRTRCVSLDQTSRQHLAKDFGSIEAAPERAFTLGIADVLESGAIMQIAGVEKLNALKRSILGPISEDCPSSILRTHPNFLLVVDEATANGLRVN